MASTSYKRKALVDEMNSVNPNCEEEMSRMRDISKELIRLRDIDTATLNRKISDEQNC